MGVRLLTEILRNAPAELSLGERMVLVVLALYARDETRQCWPGAEVIARMCGMTDIGVRRVFQRLASRGYEVRQPIGKHRAGKPLFAARGHRSVYRLPEFPSRDLPHAKPVPPYRLSDEKGGTDEPERRYGEVAKAVPPYRPNSQEPSANRQQRGGAIPGATDDETAAVVEQLRRDRSGISDALLRHILREDGPALVDKIRAEHSRVAAADAIAEARKGPPCVHGDPGGATPHPGTGEPLCALCRRAWRASA